MQFSKKVSELARLHGLDPKDVLFAMLITAGASVAESFAVIYRPPASTTAGLTTKASNFIGSRPGLRRLIKAMDEDKIKISAGDASPAKRRGRPRKDDANSSPVAPSPAPAEIDYTDKGQMLREAWEQYQGATTEAVKAKWYGIIIDLQRMDKEQNLDEKKQVLFYIPLTFDKCSELLELLKDRKDFKGDSPAGDSSGSPLLQ